MPVQLCAVFSIVIPAQAGIQEDAETIATQKHWILAGAGMTVTSEVQ